MDWLGPTLDVLKVGGGAAAGFLLKAGIEKTKGRRPTVISMDQDISRIYGNIPNWVSFPYYFDCDRKNLPTDPPERPLEWWSWAANNHGLAACTSEIQLVISTRIDRPLLVNNLRVQIETEPAPSGSIVIFPVGGADITNRQIAVTLDEISSNVRFMDEGANPLSNIAFSLKRDELAKFSITTYVDPFSPGYHRLFRWRGLLDVVIGDKIKTVPIDNHGDPFVIHGGGNTNTYSWHDGAWK